MIESSFVSGFLGGIIGGIAPALVLGVYMVYKYRKIKQSLSGGIMEMFDNNE